MHCVQHWEGDWSIRGDYNASQAPTQTAIAGMIAWLGARQAGVEAARAAFRGAAPPGVAVLHASEVNLVRTSIDVGFPNVVNTVLPGVAVDAVSYSAYDTEADAAYFGRALDFIAAHHLRTPASPVVAVYVGGAPQGAMEVGNLAGVAASRLCGCLRRVRASIQPVPVGGRPGDGHERCRHGNRIRLPLHYVVGTVLQRADCRRRPSTKC